MEINGKQIERGERYNRAPVKVVKGVPRSSWDLAQDTAIAFTGLPRGQVQTLIKGMKSHEVDDLIKECNQPFIKHGIGFFIWKCQNKSE